jgi:hypothetical protein
MKVYGADLLAKQLRKMPKTIEAQVAKAIKRNTEQAARTARSLVPVKSGELKAWIFTKYDDNGLTGSVEAAPPTKDAQTKAGAVEFGRGKGNRGKTAAQPYIRLAQKMQRKKFQTGIKSAVRRGMKDAI